MLRQRYYDVFAEKVVPPLDQLQLVVNQITPNNDFHNWVVGSYEHKGALRTLRERLRNESARGMKMDVDRLNKQFYDDVRLGVERFTKGANDTQRAAIRAYLEQLRHPVSRGDVFGTQQ